MAAEIRRGKKKKKKKKERNYRAKIYMVSLLHRATIKNFPSAKGSRIQGTC